MNDLIIVFFKQGNVIINCESIKQYFIGHTMIIELEDGTEPCITFNDNAPSVNVVTIANLVVIADVQAADAYTCQCNYRPNQD